MRHPAEKGFPPELQYSFPRDKHTVTVILRYLTRSNIIEYAETARCNRDEGYYSVKSSFFSPHHDEPLFTVMSFLPQAEIAGLWWIECLMIEERHRRFNNCFVSVIGRGGHFSFTFPRCTACKKSVVNRRSVIKASIKGIAFSALTGGDWLVWLNALVPEDDAVFSVNFTMLVYLVERISSAHKNCNLLRLIVITASDYFLYSSTTMYKIKLEIASLIANQGMLKFFLK